MSTAAVLLRGHDYGDTSRILRFYTAGHGLLSVVARGVRGRSGKGLTTLSSYASGTLTAFVKPQRDLHTMKDFSCTALRGSLGGDTLRFAGAAAVAELVLAHADQEPHAELFSALEEALDLLESAPRTVLPAAALSGLWRITESFGFAPELTSCVRCGGILDEEEVGRFDLASGGVRCADCGEGAAGPLVGPGARAQVRALVAGDVNAPLSHARRHLGLVADFVAFHVVPRPLKSLHFLGSLLPKEATPE